MHRGVGIVLVASSLACAPAVFVCEDDASCGAGTCTLSGFCAFPDEACESGLRYGDYSPEGLAGQCVREDEGTATSSSSGEAPPSLTTGGLVTGDTTGGSEPASSSTAESSTGVYIEPGCGNGVQERGEGCDDGNTIDADGCNADCRVSGEVVWLTELPGLVDLSGLAVTDEVLVAGRAEGLEPSRLARLSLDGAVAVERSFAAFAEDAGLTALAVEGDVAVVLGLGTDAEGSSTAWAGNVDTVSMEVSTVLPLWSGRAFDVLLHDGAALIGGAEGLGIAEERQQVVSVVVPLAADAPIVPQFELDVPGLISKLAADGGDLVAAGIRSEASWDYGTAVAYAGLPIVDGPIFEASSDFGYGWAQGVACGGGACYLGGFFSVEKGLGSGARVAKVWRLGDDGWTVDFDGGSTAQSNEVEAVAILGDGDVVVAGFLSTDQGTMGSWVSRLSPEGEERWRLLDTNGEGSKLRRVVVREGRIFVVGTRDNNGLVAEVSR